MADAEVKYACSEMLEHLGFPYSEIDDLHDLRDKGRVSDVLIIPESSLIEAREAEAVVASQCSLLFTGAVPEKLWDYLGCRVEAIKGFSPPRVSGLLKIDRTSTVPFFYEFPILTCEGKKLETIATVENEQGDYTGANIIRRKGRCSAIVVPQIFRSAAYLLAGSEAILPSQYNERHGSVDKHGRIDGRKTEIYKRGFSRIPIVNVYEELLFQVFLEFSRKTETPLIFKRLYPGDFDMALCITHEVEHAMNPLIMLDAIHSFAGRALDEAVAESILGLIAIFSSALSRLHISDCRNSLRLLPRFIGTKLMRLNPVWNFRRYVEIEKGFGVTSSFYFLMNRTRMDSDYDFESPLIKEAVTSLRGNGCETALHASYYSCNNSSMLKEEKLALEKALGSNIVGVRHHFNRITIPLTWEYHEKAGLLYDATFGYAQEAGFAAGICLPFMLWNFKSKKRIRTLEIPAIIADGALFQRRYLGLRVEDAWELCRQLVNTVHEYSGVLTLGWHSSLDWKRYRPWFDLYAKILEYSSSFKPWFANGEKLAEWWNLRRSISLEDKMDGSSSVTFYVNSPSQCRLSLGAFIPSGKGIPELFVNGRRLDEKTITKEGEKLIFLLNIPKGETIVVLQSRSDDQAAPLH